MRGVAARDKVGAGVGASSFDDDLILTPLTASAGSKDSRPLVFCI